MRILIVNVNWLGDVLFSTPAIRAIRKRYPESYLACLVSPRCAPLLRNNPYLDEVIPVEDKLSVRTLPDFFRAAGRLASGKFNKAIFFHRSRTKAALTAVAGIPERIGFSDPEQNRFLTRVYPSPRTKLHRTDFFLKLLEEMGISPDGRTPDFFPSKEAGEEASRLLKSEGIVEGGGYVMVHAGGNWELKRWPADHFVSWIRLFLSEFNMPVILCGTLPEEPISRGIQSHFGAQQVVSLCGKTSLDALAALLGKARFLLSNDSGPIHLAASQKTKILGLFGPTEAAITAPLSDGKVLIMKKDVGCEIPCYFRACDHRVCMDWLTPEEVFEKTKELLRDQG